MSTWSLAPTRPDGRLRNSDPNPGPWRKRTRKPEKRPGENITRRFGYVFISQEASTTANPRRRRAYGQRFLGPRQSLAAFLKKRDPRFLASDAQDPMKARAKEMAQMRADLRQAAVDRALQRQREAEEWQANQQEWQKSKQQAFSEDEEGLSGEEQQEDGWYCAACDKTFLSQGGWDNHEVCAHTTNVTNDLDWYWAYRPSLTICREARNTSRRSSSLGSRCWPTTPSSTLRPNNT